MRDTQRIEKDGNHIVMVWWIPFVYWQQTFNDSDKLTPEAKKQALDLLSAYNIVAVADVDLDALGALHGKSEADIAAHSNLARNGQPVGRLEDADLSDGMKNMMAIVRPILGNALGAFGKAMYLQVYPGVASPGDPAWERTSGRLVYGLFDHTYKWKLPLPCTLPPKHNSVTGDVFPGDYMFDPYTGDPLK